MCVVFPVQSTFFVHASLILSQTLEKKVNSNNQTSDLNNREAPLEIHADEFRKLGHQLVNEIAEFLDGLPQRPVTVDESPQVRG